MIPLTWTTQQVSLPCLPAPLVSGLCAILRVQRQQPAAPALQRRPLPRGIAALPAASASPNSRFGSSAPGAQTAQSQSQSPEPPRPLVAVAEQAVQSVQAVRQQLRKQAAAAGAAGGIPAKVSQLAAAVEEQQPTAPAPAVMRLRRLAVALEGPCKLGVDRVELKLARWLVDANTSLLTLPPQPQPLRHSWHYLSRCRNLERQALALQEAAHLLTANAWALRRAALEVERVLLDVNATLAGGGEGRAGRPWLNLAAALAMQLRRVAAEGEQAAEWLRQAAAVMDARVHMQGEPAALVSMQESRGIDKEQPGMTSLGSSPDRGEAAEAPQSWEVFLKGAPEEASQRESTSGGSAAAVAQGPQPSGKGSGKRRGRPKRQVNQQGGEQLASAEDVAAGAEVAHGGSHGGHGRARRWATAKRPSSSGAQE